MRGRLMAAGLAAVAAPPGAVPAFVTWTAGRVCVEWLDGEVAQAALRFVGQR